MNKQVPVNPEKNREEHDMPLIVVTALLVTLYLTANIMSVKVISVGSVTLFDAGTITFPFAYMLCDVLTEIWGFKTARKVIWLTFFCNIMLTVFLAVGLILPYPDYMQNTADAYRTVFTYVPRIVAASLVGFICGGISNAWVMDKMKTLTSGKFMWARTIGSSAVGYIFDTVLFVFIAFAGTAPLSDLLSMSAIQYVFKLAIEALGGTPLAYAAVHLLKKF